MLFSVKGNAADGNFQGEVEGKESTVPSREEYGKRNRLFYPNVESSYLNREYRFIFKNMNKNDVMYGKTVLGKDNILSIDEGSLEWIFF